MTSVCSAVVGLHSRILDFSRLSAFFFLLLFIFCAVYCGKLSWLPSPLVLERTLKHVFSVHLYSAMRSERISDVASYCIINNRASWFLVFLYCYSLYLSCHHGPRNDFVAGGPRANYYTKYISRPIQNIQYRPITLIVRLTRMAPIGYSRGARPPLAPPLPRPMPVIWPNKD